MKLKDLHNLKTVKRLKAKEGRNEAQLLLAQLQKLQDRDRGATTHVTKDSEKTLQQVYYASSDMKATFEKYPEHVLVDTTYCLNSCQMPLVVFMVTDGNNESRVVAVALITREKREDMDRVFKMFKDSHQNSSQIKTFMTDKDYIELQLIEKYFPDADSEICLFHVLKALRKHITDQETSMKTKKQLKELVQTMAYARSNEEYDKLAKQLESQHPLFSPYFQVNWDSIKHKWVACYRNSRQNYGDATNNRVESFNQKLKSVVQKNSPLDVVFAGLLSILELHKKKFGHREFDVLFKRPAFSKEPEEKVQQIQIWDLCTPYAATAILKQFNKRKYYSITNIDDVDTVVYNTSGLPVQYNTLEQSCHCELHMQTKLPCRHIFALRQHKGLATFTKNLVPVRWTAQHYWDQGMVPNGPAEAPEGVTSGISTLPYEPVEHTLSKQRKYKILQTQATEICSIASNVGMKQFRDVQHLFHILKATLLAGNDLDDNILVVQSLDGPMAVDDDPHVENSMADMPLESDHVECEIATVESEAQNNVLDSSECIADEGDTVDVANVQVMEEVISQNDTADIYQLTEITDTVDIRAPLKLTRRGRPKGSFQTVMGLSGKRKRSSKSCASKTSKRRGKEDTQEVLRYCNSLPPQDLEAIINACKSASLHRPQSPAGLPRMAAQSSTLSLYVDVTYEHYNEVQDVCSWLISKDMLAKSTNPSKATDVYLLTASILVRGWHKQVPTCEVLAMLPPLLER